MPRQYRIYRITHTASKHYYLMITTSRELSLNSFVTRFNDKMTAQPQKVNLNPALTWFSHNYGPFQNNQFEVIREPGEYRQQRTAHAAAVELANHLGTDLLLTRCIVDRANWRLFNKAMSDPTFAETPIEPPTHLPTQLEQRGHLNITSSPMTPNTELWQILTIPSTSSQRPILATTQRQEQFLKCAAVRHVVVASLELTLTVLGEYREQQLDHTLIHFGPSVRDVMREMDLLASAFIHNHRPESKYNFYE